MALDPSVWAQANKPIVALADATVTTNSYTFTGLPANASPRAVIIPQKGQKAQRRENVR